RPNWTTRAGLSKSWCLSCRPSCVRWICRAVSCTAIGRRKIGAGRALFPFFFKPRPMRFDALTLFPDMFNLVSESGVTGRAHKQGIWQMRTWNPRDYTADVHRTVDDRPYGGGPGMVMLADPLNDALDQALADRGDAPAVVLLSPAGRRFDQSLAQELAQGPGAVLVCGRYEGIDQRFIDERVTLELSLGDFVLSGGEIASLAI